MDSIFLGYIIRLCLWLFTRLENTSAFFARLSHLIKDATDMLLTLNYGVTVINTETLSIPEFYVDAFVQFKSLMLHMERSKPGFYKVCCAHALAFLNVFISLLKPYLEQNVKTIKRRGIWKMYFKTPHMPHNCHPLVVYPFTMHNLAKEIGNGESSMEHLMRYEWSRYISFQTFPQDSVMRPMRLVQAGFYYAGHGEQVRCFCCGVTNGSWAPDDTAMEVHRRLSPECRFMLEEQTNNVRIHSDEYYDGVIQTARETSANNIEPDNSNISFNNQNVSHMPSDGLPENSGEENCTNSDVDRHLRYNAQTGFFSTGGSLFRGVSLRNYQRCDGNFTRLSTNNFFQNQVVPASVTVPNLPINDPVDNAELRQRVSALQWREMILEEENQTLRDRLLCKVCREREVCIICEPCGHMAVCQPCSERLDHCAICRAAIRAKRRVYLS